MGIKLSLKQRSVISVVALVAMGLWPLRGFTWANHARITELSLEGVSALQGKTLIYHPFQVFLSKVGISDEKAFNEFIQIHKSYRFRPELKEEDAKGVSLLSVLSKYADEPDWEMDQNLFEADQYPELWQGAYAMMGGKTGIPSQAHRHLYWRKFSFLSPVKTFHLPTPHALGLAKERAQIFLNLSEQAKSVGEPYWQVRFFSNALHYLQDISSPFHSTQTPTKRFLGMGFRKSHFLSFGDFVKKTTKIVTYYHFSFEDFIGEVLSGQIHPKTDVDLLEALKAAPGPKLASKLKEASKDFGTLFDLLHRSSEKNSAKAARTAIQFFPKLPKKIDEFEAHAYMDAIWWEDVKKRAATESKTQKSYMGVVRNLFELLGESMRLFVLEELKL